MLIKIGKAVVWRWLFFCEKNVNYLLKLLDFIDKYF